METELPSVFRFRSLLSYTWSDMNELVCEAWALFSFSLLESDN